MTITVSKTFASEAEAIDWLNGGTTESTAAETTGKPKAETTGKPKAETTGKPAKPAKPTITQAQMQAALQEVKEKFGVPEAKAIIVEAGGVKKMDEISEDKYETVFKACQAKLEEENEGAAEDDGI